MLGTPVPQGRHAREFSDETERLMDHAVRDLVGYAFDRAIEILNVHRPLHEKTAQLLLQKETLEEEDIAALRAQISPAEAAEATPRPTGRGHPPVGARLSRSTISYAPQIANLACGICQAVDSFNCESVVNLRS